MSALILKNLLGSLLLPPANGLLLLLLAGLFRRRRWAFGLAALGTLLLLAQSLPPVAKLLISTLEERAGPVLRDADGARAIVVLGSGLRLQAAEYGGDTVNERTLLRLRYGATLARQLNLPVLVSGGLPLEAERTEAEVIAGVLEGEFGVPVRWRESASRDTAENAALSARLLHAAGIRRIVLVTQAFHMPRAQRLFAAAGLEVVPAPTDFMGRRERPDRGREALVEALDWLPQAKALHISYYALHEWLGLAWLDLLQALGRGNGGLASTGTAPG